ncbi:hypothetical protein HPP92_015154 [Vanilla planifolia]|uniref:Acyl-CoA-binding domain-containing protein n=1 Tax=Vanilla planifolia TaxID=51239 RepID=A0A835QQZ1_VANPL|nr:hypothetical protein HPP92_015154 [Vanilla planifolia]
MPKMFGFSRRRTKLGRLKVHLGDPSQEIQNSTSSSKLSPLTSEDNVVGASASGRSEEHNCECSMAGSGISKSGVGCSENWMVVPTSGDKPAPRFHHAAAVVGSKMVVVGGDSGHGMLNDTNILTLDKLSWAAARTKMYGSPMRLKFPACKDHCLVSWGNSVLLVGGKTDHPSGGVLVWSFDVDIERWSNVEVKGDIPVARGGHTVIRAGPVLILFGGEDKKGRKLHDLHMFDLKSSTWLPLHYTWYGQRLRRRGINHHLGQVAAEYFVEINGYAETLVFDVSKLEWSVSVMSSNDSIANARGFSLVSVHHKEKLYLVAFGGNRKEPSNQIEILVMVKHEHSMSWRCAPGSDILPYEGSSVTPDDLVAHLCNNAIPRSVARCGLAVEGDHHASGRKSLSDSSIDPSSSSGSISLRRQFHNDEEYNGNQKMYIEEDKCKAGNSSSEPYNPSLQQESTVKMDITGTSSTSDNDTAHIRQKPSDAIHLLGGDPIAHVEAVNEAVPLTNPSNINQLYETRIATLTRKNALLEAQLCNALANQEAAERNLSSVVKSRQEVEKKLTDTTKEVELLKEKLANLEQVQEEANSLSNMVHSDNVRLEHDVAFLKAVLDDTQKELHSTRGVLAGEKARAFQLQVEVFHLKQRLQTLEGRTPTPRKPFHL